MGKATDIFTEAMDLPTSQRARLARQLILSLESDEFDADVESAWAEEIERRSGLLKSGKSKTTDARQAVERIRSKLPPKPLK